MGVLSDRQIQEELGKTGRIKPFRGYENPSPTGQISSGLSSFGYDVTLGYTFKIFDPLYRGVIDPKNFDPAICKDVEVGNHDFVGVGEGDPLKRPDICKTCGLLWDDFKNGKGDECDNFIVLPPHGFALARTIEELTVPRDCLVLALSKSTLLRCGMYNSTSVLEPEWRGTVTLELSNLTPLPLKVYAGEGICQLVFFRSDERLQALVEALSFDSDTLRKRWTEIKKASCGTSYADKNKAGGRYMNQQDVTLPSVRKE